MTAEVLYKSFFFSLYFLTVEVPYCSRGTKSRAYILFLAPVSRSGKRKIIVIFFLHIFPAWIFAEGVFLPMTLYSSPIYFCTLFMENSDRGLIYIFKRKSTQGCYLRQLQTVSDANVFAF